MELFVIPTGNIFYVRHNLDYFGGVGMAQTSRNTAIATYRRSRSNGRWKAEVNVILIQPLGQMLNYHIHTAGQIVFALYSFPLQVIYHAVNSFHCTSMYFTTLKCTLLSIAIP